VGGLCTLLCTAPAPAACGKCPWNHLCKACVPCRHMRCAWCPHSPEAVGALGTSLRCGRSAQTHARHGPSSQGSGAQAFVRHAPGRLATIRSHASLARRSQQACVRACWHGVRPPGECCQVQKVDVVEALALRVAPAKHHQPVVVLVKQSAVVVPGRAQQRW